MTLKELGWNDRIDGAFESFRVSGLSAARVVREDRESYVIYGPVTTGSNAGRSEREFNGREIPIDALPCRASRAVLRGALRHRAGSRQDFPAVGDWVAVQPAQSDGPGSPAVIHAILPRASVIVRKAAGTGAGEQLVAANVDTLLICCGLDGDFNPRRIERYLTLGYGSGAAPAVVLTKADICFDVNERVAEIESVAIGVPVIRVGWTEEAGVEAVRQLVRPGTTAALVGSSGVGKSTLINRLLRHEAMATGAVRASDQRGRHTTTHRQLVLLPGGGVMIDTPGLRELQLWADAADVGSSFADIDEFAAACRFRDCSHNGEPGCGVQAALDRGDLAAERYESFRKLEREIRFQERKSDRSAAAAEKARWKVIHKSAQKWMREKYRY